MKQRRNIAAKAAPQRGSILMETLLVIPLYIAFFSGIYLLGDLGIGRARLTAADRFSVWTAGCRHEQKDDEAVKKKATNAFFPRGDFAEGTKIDSFRSGKTEVNWYALIQGAASLKIVLPVWAVQCRKGALRLMADIGTKPDESTWDNVSFRARDVEESDTHSVLMRTEYEVRDKSGRELAQGAPLWFIEYQTAYIDKSGNPVDRPGSHYVCSGMEYTRSPIFDAWSR